MNEIETEKPALVAPVTAIELPNGLSSETGEMIRLKFEPFAAQAQEWMNKANAITIAGVEDKAGMKLARESRLGARAVRIAIEKTREELKKDALVFGKTVDGIAKKLRESLEVIEEELQAKEEFAIREEEKRVEAERIRLQELRSTRMTELRKYVDMHEATPVEQMTEEQFQSALTDARMLHEIKSEQARKAEEARLQAEREAEEKRIAAENARMEEEARIRRENERLRKEAGEREAAHRAEQEALRIERERERVASEEAARMEREKMMAERRAAEAKAAAERAAEQARARQEEQKRREELAEIRRQQAEAEAARRKEIEAERAAREKAEAAAAALRAEEEERLAKQEAKEKAAAMAPDREKLVELAYQLGNYNLPAMSTKEGTDIMKRVNKELLGLSKSIKSEANLILI